MILVLSLFLQGLLPVAYGQELFDTNTANSVAWTAIQFPISNHYQLRRQQFQFSKIVGEWASRWMNNMDPDGLLFHDEDHRTLEEVLSKCTKGNTLSRLVFWDCIYEFEYLLAIRFEFFVETSERLIQAKEFNLEGNEYLEQSSATSTANYAQTVIEVENRIRRMMIGKVIQDLLNGQDQVTARSNLNRWLDQMKERLSKRNNMLQVTDFINAYYAAFDPHTRYMNPKDTDDLSDKLSGSSVGIGTKLSKNDIGEIIVKPLPGSPAERRGIQAGDVLLGVYAPDNMTLRLTDVLSVGDVYQLLQRPVGESIMLRIRRTITLSNEFKGLREFDVVVPNALISQDSLKVVGRVYQKNKRTVFSFSAADFYRGFSNDLAELYERLHRIYGKPQGVVLDLSGNPGGHLDEALSIVGLFSDKPIVTQTHSIEQTVFGSSYEIKSLKSARSPVIYDGPLVVKIDEKSISGSEIVAAYFQDSKRALIVGHRSFGKGSIQRIYPAFHQSMETMMSRYRESKFFNFPTSEDKFKYGSFKTTIGKFYRIDGSSTQYVGVIPDVYLYRKDQIQAPYYESSLPNSLTPDYIDPSLIVENKQAHPFVQKALKNHIELTLNALTNPNLSQIGNYIGREINESLYPQSLNYERRLQDQKLKIKETKNLLGTLRKNSKNSGIVRNDHFFEQSSLQSLENVQTYQSSAEGHFARVLDENDDSGETLFRFEKSRAEMNQILRIFFDADIH